VGVASRARSVFVYYLLITHVKFYPGRI
jgi:hypothetical protein